MLLLQGLAHDLAHPLVRRGGPTYRYGTNCSPRPFMKPTLLFGVVGHLLVEPLAHQALEQSRERNLLFPGGSLELHL